MGARQLSRRTHQHAAGPTFGPCRIGHSLGTVPAPGGSVVARVVRAVSLDAVWMRIAIATFGFHRWTELLVQRNLLLGASPTLAAAP